MMKSLPAVWPHLLAWAVILLFVNAGVFQWRWQAFSSEDGTLLIPSLYGSAFNALIFYGHALWLYPKKKDNTLVGNYWIWVITGLFMFSGVEGAIDYVYSQQLGTTPQELQSLPAGAQTMVWAINNALFHLAYWMLSFVCIRLRQSRRIEQQQTALVQENLTTELRYLRAQINPHVLFNGINSVYHLIDEQPDRAKQTLLTFSNLLRYQLYECQADRVPLDKELAHLTDYISLEETRKGEDAIIVWDVQDHDPMGQIAPLLLQPFVENAFKYLSHHDNPEQNQLHLSLAIDQGVLSLKVENTVATPAISEPTTTGSGVGLSNVRRRLQLIYPDRHQLFVSQPPGMFHVHLIITL